MFGEPDAAGAHVAAVGVQAQPDPQPAGGLPLQHVVAPVLVGDLVGRDPAPETLRLLGQLLLAVDHDEGRRGRISPHGPVGAGENGETRVRVEPESLAVEADHVDGRLQQQPGARLRLGRVHDADMGLPRVRFQDLVFSRQEQAEGLGAAKDVPARMWIQAAAGPHREVARRLEPHRVIVVRREPPPQPGIPFL